VGTSVNVECSTLRRRRVRSGLCLGMHSTLSGHPLSPLKNSGVPTGLNAGPKAAVMVITVGVAYDIWLGVAPMPFLH
jgi:hypothetical protein